MGKSRGRELVERYKARYGEFPGFELTEEMVLRHWDLEKSLTREILESSKEDRWEVVERCYTRLYNELPWLNQAVNSQAKEPPAERFSLWTKLIGPPPKRVYEIGSGKSQLITYLAECGYECKGTEITRERGKVWASDLPNISWGSSDGIHLHKFESDRWDVVISNHVIEHMHPDDVLDHFKGVRVILSKGGRYIFSVPHRATGPHDVSAVFKCDRSAGMHLKEYTHTELASMLRKAGFGRISSPLIMPQKMRRALGFRPLIGISTAYLAYLKVAEIIIGLVPTQRLRRFLANRLTTLRLFASNIWIVAEEPRE